MPAVSTGEISLDKNNREAEGMRVHHPDFDQIAIGTIYEDGGESQFDFKTELYSATAHTLKGYIASQSGIAVNTTS